MSSDEETGKSVMNVETVYREVNSKHAWASFYQVREEEGTRVEGRKERGKKSAGRRGRAEKRLALSLGDGSSAAASARKRGGIMRF